MADFPPPKTEKKQNDRVLEMPPLILSMSLVEAAPILKKWSEPFRDPKSGYQPLNDMGITVMRLYLNKCPDTKALQNLQHELLANVKGTWSQVHFYPGKGNIKDMRVEVRLVPKTRKDLELESKSGAKARTPSFP